MTIGDRERQLRDALLIAVETNPDLAWLVRNEWVPVVQLRENGRKKRADAKGDYWSPETGEVFVTFQQLGDRVKGKMTARAEEVLGKPEYHEKSGQRGSHVIPTPTLAPANTPVPNGEQPLASAGRMENPEVLDLLQHLHNAETQEKQRGGDWVALTRFRDQFVSPVAPWFMRRNELLQYCLGAGFIEKGKAPNPYKPAYPVTTVKLSPSGRKLLGIS